MPNRTSFLTPERPLAPVQWAAIAGSLLVLMWSIPGLIINPDFATGDDATAVMVLGSDMNGWHAVSGFLVAGPGLFSALRREWAGLFDIAGAASLSATAVWALLSERVAGGLIYLPNQLGDAAFHFGVSAVLIAGAMHWYFFDERRTPATTPAAISS